MKKTFLFLFFFSTLFSNQVCEYLDSSDKIHKYILQTIHANPISNGNSSVALEIITKKRRGGKTKSSIHMVNHKEKRRVVFIEGDNKGRCIVGQGEKKYKCGDCSLTSNTLCREMKEKQTTTKILGTNIDMTDFDTSRMVDYTSSCHPVKRRKNYVQIESINTGKKRKYDKIVSYYEFKRELPVARHYFEKGVLKKVYNFFPREYKKIDGKWMATVVRVRSVEHKEKNYQFETVVKIKRDSKYKYMLFDDITKDKKINSVPVEELFVIK
ncbi:MAG: hypothetical protein OIF32_11070 [Campylobacterales bacterium]|nr:hypothetical protein [Campylobacterales bacterium]